VAAFTSFSRAAGTADPVPSETEPEIEPVMDWAKAGAEAKISSSANPKADFRSLLMLIPFGLTLLQEFEQNKQNK
jgi:hypothetical protein